MKLTMYAQAAEIRSDFAQIAANAAAYNAPGCGQFGGPGVPRFHGTGSMLIISSAQQTLPL